MFLYSASLYNRPVFKAKRSSLVQLLIKTFQIRQGRDVEKFSSTINLHSRLQLKVVQKNTISFRNWDS